MKNRNRQLEYLKVFDEQISKISKSLDFYACLTPVNQEEQRIKFFKNLALEKEYNPVFKYIQRDFSQEKEKLSSLSKELKVEPKCLDTLFLKKIDHLYRQIELLTCEDKNFGNISSDLYGAPGDEDVDISHKILIQTSKQEYMFPEETVTPEEMVSVLKQKITEKNIKNWTVSLSNKIIPKLSVSGRDKTIYVKPTLNYTQEEIQRLMVHEVEVHVYRALNGARQPFKIFTEGLAGYDETEEGLAIIAEERAGCLSIDKRQIKLYAGRCFAVKKAFNNSFYDTYIFLTNFFPSDLSYRLTERVKRGLKETLQKGAFTKDLHYIAGFNKTQRYVKEKGDITILYAGKIGLNDVECVRSLIEEGILKEPKYLPEYMK